MTAIEKERLRIKVFIGVQLTPDLRIQLNKSTLWKQAQIGSCNSSLKEIYANEKNYLGYYIDQDPAPLDILKNLEAKIHHSIQTYCPDFNTSRIPVQVFSQIFIE